MERYTIVRSKWLRGERESFLLREDGKMCCLGQICEQAGISKSRLLNREFPWSLRKRSDVPPWMLENNIGHVRAMTMTNDMIEIDDEVREERLKELANRLGVTLEFVD